MGELVSIVYKPQGAVAATEGYIRVPLQEAMLVAGQGIDGDMKGGIPARQLNIMTAETVEQLTAIGFHTKAGELGEQLILREVEVDSLSVGTRLQIGASACVEVTEPRTGCGKLERYHGKQRTEASGRLGVMARVVTSGSIRVGDEARIVESAGSPEQNSAAIQSQ